MKQSILSIHHQIILIHKPDYVDFLLKHSPFQREPKQLSISYFTHCFFYLIFTVFFPLPFSPLQPPSPRTHHKVVHVHESASRISTFPSHIPHTQYIQDLFIFFSFPLFLQIRLCAQKCLSLISSL